MLQEQFSVSGLHPVQYLRLYERPKDYSTDYA